MPIKLHWRKPQSGSQSILHLQAWEREEILMDKGMRLLEECFDGVKAAEYQMNMVAFEGGD